MAMEIHQPGPRAYKPCAALQSVVSSYIVANNAYRETITMIQPAFPTQYLIFYPYRPQSYSLDAKSFHSLSRELFVGPFTKPVYLISEPSEPLIIVRLHPGYLHRLSRIPMYEVLNKPIDGTDGLSTEIKRVNERLSYTKTQEQMIELIEAFLLKRIETAKETLPIDHTFKLVIADPNRHSIDQLADLSCVSVRQYERQFLERIGTSPTTFIRQARFMKAMRLRRDRSELSWSAIAYECGYFDQMHLIRDFKAFTSFTPTSFRNWVSGPATINA
jgi:AraC-like DNA-binding protein